MTKNQLQGPRGYSPDRTPDTDGSREEGGGSNTGIHTIVEEVEEGTPIAKIESGTHTQGIVEGLDVAASTELFVDASGAQAEVVASLITKYAACRVIGIANLGVGEDGELRVIVDALLGLPHLSSLVIELNNSRWGVDPFSVGIEMFKLLRSKNTLKELEISGYGSEELPAKSAEALGEGLGGNDSHLKKVTLFNAVLLGKGVEEIGSAGVRRVLSGRRCPLPDPHQGYNDIGGAQTHVTNGVRQGVIKKVEVAHNRRKACWEYLESNMPGALLVGSLKLAEIEGDDDLNALTDAIKNRKDEVEVVVSLSDADCDLVQAGLKLVQGIKSESRISIKLELVNSRATVEQVRQVLEGGNNIQVISSDEGLRLELEHSYPQAFRKSDESVGVGSHASSHDVTGMEPVNLLPQQPLELGQLESIEPQVPDQEETEARYPKEEANPQSGVFRPLSQPTTNPTGDSDKGAGAIETQSLAEEANPQTPPSQPETANNPTDDSDPQASNGGYLLAVGVVLGAVAGAVLVALTLGMPTAISPAFLTAAVVTVLSCAALGALVGYWSDKVASQSEGRDGPSNPYN